MSDTNVGMGMVRHRQGCRCDECEIERLQARVAELEGALRQIAEQTRDSGYGPAWYAYKYAAEALQETEA